MFEQRKGIGMAVRRGVMRVKGKCDFCHITAGGVGGVRLNGLAISAG